MDKSPLYVPAHMAKYFSKNIWWYHNHSVLLNHSSDYHQPMVDETHI